MVNLRLFCLPYAGASAEMYRDWDHYLPTGVETVPLELPGRGRRFHESPATDLDDVVKGLVESIVSRANEPFAIFGYSYGALLGFETAVRLQQEYGIECRRLFAAAARAAVCPRLEPPASELADHDFLHRLRTMDGTPPDLLDNDEFMEIMLPVLRADFTVADRYQYTPGPLLNAPITAFGATDDLTVTWDSVHQWRRCTESNSVVRWVPGNHFFIHARKQHVLSLLSSELRSIER